MTRSPTLPAWVTVIFGAKFIFSLAVVIKMLCSDVVETGISRGGSPSETISRKTSPAAYYDYMKGNACVGGFCLLIASVSAAFWWKLRDTIE